MSEGNNHNVKKIAIGVISAVVVVATVVGAVLWHKSKNGDNGK